MPITLWILLNLVFQSPSQGEEAIKKKLDALHVEIQDKFRQLVE